MKFVIVAVSAIAVFSVQCAACSVIVRVSVAVCSMQEFKSKKKDRKRRKTRREWKVQGLRGNFPCVLFFVFNY